MIEETIRQIETRLNDSTKLSPEARTELLGLLAKLRAETAQLPVRENAASGPLAEVIEVKTLQDDVTRLRHSVQEFEDSHPKVVQLVNHIANILSGLGI